MFGKLFRLTRAAVLFFTLAVLAAGFSAGVFVENVIHQISGCK